MTERVVVSFQFGRTIPVCQPSYSPQSIKAGRPDTIRSTPSGLLTRKVEKEINRMSFREVRSFALKPLNNLQVSVRQWARTYPNVPEHDR
jgi:hypothetical protein